MIEDLHTIRKALDQLHRETCEEGGQNFAFSPAYLAAYAATNRLEADAQVLADMRTLDEWARTNHGGWNSAPGFRDQWYRTCVYADGLTPSLQFDGATPDEARHKAAEWVRAQAKGGA